MFNRYINGLADLLKSKGFEIFYYADGLAAIANGLNRVTVVVGIVKTWGKRNLMEINKSKCGVMVLAEQQQLTSKEIILKTILFI